MKLNIDTIQPTEQNAIKMLTMAQDDLLSLQIDKKEVRRIANPANEQHVHEQLQMLKVEPASFRGAYVHGDLVGYAHATDHLASDERHYEGPLSKLILPGFENEQNERLSNNPLGIFALSVTRAPEGTVTNERARLVVADNLLQTVVKQNEAKYGDMRVGLHERDPFKRVFEGQGFERTRKVAKVAGVALRQYVRPSKKRS